MPEKVFTKNDAIALMHKDRASSLRKIAEHIRKYQLSLVDTYILLMELADEAEAQAMVVDLRDTL
jgi:hypothetical protein